MVIRMYKKKLKALLAALEVRHIDEFMNKTPDHFTRLGHEIKKYAKIGASVEKVMKTGEQRLLKVQRRITNGKK